MNSKLIIFPIIQDISRHTFGSFCGLNRYWGLIPNQIEWHLDQVISDGYHKNG